MQIPLTLEEEKWEKIRIKNGKGEEKGADE
jgi:hypothetical protein